jgi:hypothetical protein
MSPTVHCPQVLPALEELEYRGTVTYRPSVPELSIDLMVGLFPASEGYGAINDGPATILFRQAPPAGIAASSSAAAARRRIRTVVDDVTILWSDPTALRRGHSAS